jgi:hypothetical protein
MLVMTALKLLAAGATLFGLLRLGIWLVAHDNSSTPILEVAVITTIGMLVVHGVTFTARFLLDRHSVSCGRARALDIGPSVARQDVRNDSDTSS